MLNEKIALSIDKYSSIQAIEIPRIKQSVTYAEMAALGNQLATDISAEPDSVLILCVDKSIEAVSLFTHAFIAGYSICPVDPRMPENGVSRIAAQFAKSTIITNNPLGADLDWSSSRCQVHGKSDIGWTVEKYESSQGYSCPKIPAYFIATSGSTGKPKLVHVPQENVKKILLESSLELKSETQIRWAQFSSMGFDLFIEDLLLTILSGGTLVLPTGLAEFSRIGNFVAENEITHWNSVPSIIPRLTKNPLPTLKRAVFCGEPLLVEHCKMLSSQAPNVEIYNTYCPTETALYSSEYKVDSTVWSSDEFSTAPIGNPTCGANFVFIEESEGLRCIILSPYIAEGYWGGDKTGFGEISLAGTVQRYFDTGDYFQLKNGEYIFSHRSDKMIKVRGNRVDLGELQNAFAQIGLPEVGIWFSDDTIYLATDDRSMSESDIISELSKHVPTYMYPGKFIQITELPRTQSGKVDLNALRRGDYEDGK